MSGLSVLTDSTKLNCLALRKPRIWKALPRTSHIHHSKINIVTLCKQVTSSWALKELCISLLWDKNSSSGAQKEHNSMVRRENVSKRHVWRSAKISVTFVDSITTVSNLPVFLRPLKDLFQLVNFLLLSSVQISLFLQLQSWVKLYFKLIRKAYGGEGTDLKVLVNSSKLEKSKRFTEPIKRALYIYTYTGLCLVQGKKSHLKVQAKTCSGAVIWMKPSPDNWGWRINLRAEKVGPDTHSEVQTPQWAFV